jgi:hypothetical protein
MTPVKVRLSPRHFPSHSQLTLRMELKRPLHGWELKDLTSSLRVWTGRQSLLVLPAEAPSDWVEEWSCSIDDVLDGTVGVQFVGARRDGRSR